MTTETAARQRRGMDAAALLGARPSDQCSACELLLLVPVVQQSVEQDVVDNYNDYLDVSLSVFMYGFMGTKHDN